MFDVRRREFITLLGGAAAWPTAARAQPRSSALPRIGYLVAGAADDQEALARHAAFREALEKQGWVDGRTVGIDARWGSQGQERVRAAVADLVGGMAPMVILSEGSPNTQALQRQTCGWRIHNYAAIGTVESIFFGSWPNSLAVALAWQNSNTNNELS